MRIPLECSALDDQDREDAKEEEIAAKMNKRVAEADELSNKPCLLCLSTAGLVKRVDRVKGVRR